jgi:hypothetical protein
MPDSPGTTAAALRRIEEEYLSSEYVDHEFDVATVVADVFDILETLGNPTSDAVERAARRTADRAESVARVSPGATRLEAVRPTVGTVIDAAGGTTETVARAVRLLAAWVGVAATGVDIRMRFPNLSPPTGIEALNGAIEALSADEYDAAVRRLRTAAQETAATAAAVGAAERLWADLSTVSFPGFVDLDDAFGADLRAAVDAGAPDRVESIGTGARTMIDRSWSRDDLLACSATEFEQLVADCWRARGAEARTTRPSGDRGIDVVVATGTGDRIVVQAKRNSPGNTVGIDVVQRTAGLTVEFDADRAAVVTSSSFTATAEDSADRSSVILVDGERLCELLDDAGVVPPPAHE